MSSLMRSRKMPRKKSLGMGGDPSQRMFATAKELLWRQRQIHKFPCDRDDVLISLLPGELQDYVVDHTVGGDAVKNVRWENLTHCVNLGMTSTIEIDGENGKAFWFGWNGGKPAPVSPSQAFAMYASHPNYDEIVEWWGPAFETHKRLMHMEELLHTFFQKATHPVIVKRHWPDLHKFVDFKVGPSNSLSDGTLNKRRVIKMPTEYETHEIITTLAGSTLLPKYDCNAWVDYETEDW